MEQIELRADKRELVGKSLKALRKQGFLPSVIYGRDFETTPIQVEYLDFEKVFKQAGESSLISLKLAGREEFAVIKDIQRDPLTEKIIHADFHKVSLKEKIKAKIPVVFSGDSEAVKAGGVLVRTLNELEVEALPQDLPHEISADISVLKNFGEHILVKDILAGMGDRVKVLAGPDEIVVLIQEPRKEELEEVAPPSVEEVEVIKKEEKKEEEAPIEEPK